MDAFNDINSRKPWNKAKLKEILAIRIRLQISKQVRDLALFNLALDSKLRSCDLVKIRVRDVTHGATVSRRAMVMQQKTGLTVQFEITEQTRQSTSNCINHANWPRSGRVRYTFAAMHEGLIDIPEDQEFEGGTDSIGSHEDGKYYQILGHRGRGCAGNGGTDRNLARNRPGTPSGAFWAFSIASAGEMLTGGNLRPIAVDHNHQITAHLSS